MSAIDLFHAFKWVIGGMRNDTPPTVADGTSAALRLNPDSELMVSVASSSSSVTTEGEYRTTELELSDGESAALGLSKEGYLITRSDWEPIDGGGTSINYTDVASSAGPLTVGAEYHLIATTKCYITVGGNGIAATSSDYLLLQDTIFPYVARTGKDYVSAIRHTDSGTLTVCRVR